MNEAEFGGDKHILLSNFDLMELVNEALEYVIKIKFSAFIHRVITSEKGVNIKGIIDNFVTKTTIPISN